MNKLPALSMLVLLAVCVTACDDPSSIPTAVDPEAAAYAAAKGKPGGGEGGADTDSRAKLVFDDAAGLKITSDAGGAYTGDACDGVYAKIFYHNADLSRSGDLVFDPDKNHSSCGPARSLTFDFGEGSPISASPFVNVRAIMQIGATGKDPLIEAKYPTSPDQYGQRDNPSTQQLRFTMLGLPGCDELRTTVTVERTAGAEAFDDETGWATGPPGAWAVASTGDHLATCYYAKGRNLVEGVTAAMPFAFIVLEVVPQ